MTQAQGAGSQTVGQALVRQLAIHGVKRVSCVPGESYLAVLDALRDSDIEVIVCRHEGGAAMMADAWGRATGEPGVAFVTRSPGAANAMLGVQIAYQDNNPMLLFVGLADDAMRGLQPWQDIDLARAFADCAKATFDIRDPDSVGQIIADALRIAVSGKPGPVVIGMPHDVLHMIAGGPDGAPVGDIEVSPESSDIEAVRQLLATAKSPFVILGGTRWDEASRDAIRQFAEHFSLPVATSYRRCGLFDFEHPLFAGDLGIGPNPKLVARIKSADVLLLLGGRLGEIPSQRYTLLPRPDPGLKLAHAFADPAELGRLYTPTVGIHATPRRLAPALAALPAPNAVAWAGQAEQAHADYLAWTETATPQPGGVNLGEVIVHLRTALEPGAILCNGAGGYAAWLHRFYRMRHLNAHLAPASGAMGYGPPAAAAMQAMFPGRRVVCLGGDGDFLMNGQEFATLIQYDLPVICIVADNGSYGSIRMSQERVYPARVSATDLRNPDFAAYARAFGGFGVTVERTEDFPAALEAAKASGVASIIHLKISVECMTPTHTVEMLRAGV